MDSLQGKSILLGVCGGVAAYKAAALASQLVQAGAHVNVIMTAAAREFVQPLTFSAITHTAVHTDMFAPWHDEFRGHVSLAATADLLIVAPATARTLAGLALGLSDDLLQLVAMSTSAPIIVAPAMEDGMYRHPATQLHIAMLRDREVTVVGPDRGRLASGAVGEGRLAAPETIVAAARWVLGRTGPLAGCRIVVSAGGTREPIDPVRYIGNRSSGAMGFAIASAAEAAGADVTIVSGPVHQTAPYGASHVSVETALEMQEAIVSATQNADVLIMAAAVADFRPVTSSDRKIKKEPGQEHLGLDLVRNPDILSELNSSGLIRIGFAAETDDLLENARQKLAAKRLDAIVANDASTTIGAADSQATVLVKDGRSIPLPRLPKEAVANEIIALVVELLRAEHRNPV